MRQYVEKATIFLVDDDKEEFSFFEDALKEINATYSLKHFSSCENLIDYLENNPSFLPTIIFLDLHMQGMSGMECLRILRSKEKYKDLSIAIYSNSTIYEYQDQAFTNGANVYIAKPSSFESMKKVIKHILTVCSHYDSSNLNRDTFLISV